VFWMGKFGWAFDGVGVVEKEWQETCLVSVKNIISCIASV
jgi:hypothetical protein